MKAVTAAIALGALVGSTSAKPIQNAATEEVGLPIATASIDIPSLPSDFPEVSDLPASVDEAQEDAAETTTDEPAAETTTDEPSTEDRNVSASMISELQSVLSTVNNARSEVGTLIGQGANVDPAVVASLIRNVDDDLINSLLGGGLGGLTGGGVGKDLLSQILEAVTDLLASLLGSGLPGLGGLT